MRENIPEFAIHWANQLGASQLSIERLRGGINNQVFRCSRGVRHWVIKGYGPVISGQRDRMQAEVQFLNFSACVAANFTPEVVEIDPTRRCVVLEHLEGEPFDEGISASNSELESAVRFFRQLNSERSLAQQTIHLDAAEGFLSLREHLNNVRERRKRMVYKDLEDELRLQAKNLLSRLDSELDSTEYITNKLIERGSISDEIDPDSRCISPSDFGFHNALRSSKGVYFFDFEFSGWDDPAKAIQDFILQPRVPIAQKRSPLLDAFPEEIRTEIEHRCSALGPILRLKWSCIILAVLQQDRLDNMLRIMPEEAAHSLVGKRLKKADSYLENIH